MLLEVTQKHAVDSENEAKDMIESFRATSKEKGYIIKKAGYERKTKKNKGEKWVVTIVQTFAGIWDEDEE